MDPRVRAGTEVRVPICRRGEGETDSNHKKYMAELTSPNGEKFDHVSLCQDGAPPDGTPESTYLRAVHAELKQLCSTMSNQQQADIRRTQQMKGGHTAGPSTRVRTRASRAVASVGTVPRVPKCPARVDLLRLHPMKQYTPRVYPTRVELTRVNVCCSRHLLQEGGTTNEVLADGGCRHAADGAGCGRPTGAHAGRARTLRSNS